MVGIPSILDGFPTAWMEIQPLGLVCLGVVVNAGECVFDIAPLFQMPTGLHEIVGLGAKNNPYRTTEAYLDSDA